MLSQSLLLLGAPQGPGITVPISPESGGPRVPQAVLRNETPSASAVPGSGPSVPAGCWGTSPWCAGAPRKVCWLPRDTRAMGQPSLVTKATRVTTSQLRCWWGAPRFRSGHGTCTGASPHSLFLCTQATRSAHSEEACDGVLGLWWGHLRQAGPRDPSTSPGLCPGCDQTVAPRWDFLSWRSRTMMGQGGVLRTGALWWDRDHPWDHDHGGVKTVVGLGPCVP